MGSRTFIHRSCRARVMSLAAWLIPMWGLMTGGCDSTLVFAERTSFSLAVHVNDNPSTPVEVSAGLKRDVAAVVPPNDVVGQNGEKVPVGEATSLLSGFRLHHDTKDTVLPFDDVVTIRTQFASGYAARDVTGDKERVKAVSTIVNVRLAEPVSEELQKRREAAVQFIEGLNAQQVNDLARALGIAEDAHAKSNLRVAVSQAENVDAFEIIAQKIKLLFGKEV